MTSPRNLQIAPNPVCNITLMIVRLSRCSDAETTATSAECGLLVGYPCQNDVLLAAAHLFRPEKALHLATTNAHY
jgi:hypothetical protein